MTQRAVMWIGATVVAIPLAILGVVVYARRPDVDTYWLNVLLIGPLCAIVTCVLHRILPLRLQWIGACLIAPLGGVAYLIWPNDQWWNYGVLTAMPLVLLAANQAERKQEERGDEADSWYGLGDGPWGPP